MSEIQEMLIELVNAAIIVLNEAESIGVKDEASYYSVEESALVELDNAVKRYTDYISAKIGEDMVRNG